MDRIPANVQRLMFWTNMLSGAAGHTYGANGIWQVNRKGQPYGNSPHGGNYGVIPWDEAMKLPGSQQLALAKRLLKRYPWHRFEPHAEWASWKNREHDDEFMVPYAAGVPGSVRIVYIPKPWPVAIKKLENGTQYTASHFDPITGKSNDLGAVSVEAEGTWNQPPPPHVEEDWVLVLETPEADP